MNQIYRGTYRRLESVEPFEYSKYKSCKNMPYAAALCAYASTPIRDVVILLAGQLSLPYKYVDVKVHKLKKKEVPCIPGWHLDRVHKHHSEYALMVAGVSLTEFNPLPYETNLRQPMTKVNQDLIAHLPESEVFAAKDWEPIYYDNLMPHRGVPAQAAGLRLLIRVVATTNKDVHQTPNFKPGIYT